MISGAQLKRRAGSAFVVLLLCLAACSKKEEPASPRPALTVPESTFSSNRKSAPPEKVSAQAEVKASSGPVELSLLLYKTKIKLGDSLWHQLRIRNVGKQELLVTDQVFHDPWQLERSIPSRYGGGGYGIYIEVIAPDGELADKTSPTSYAEADVEKDGRISGLLEVEGPEEMAMLEGWKKKGLPFEEINLKLMDFNRKKRDAARAKHSDPIIKLQPGESAQTKSWFYYNELERIAKKPVPHPIGDFQELESVQFGAIGIYKVRAVYDQAPTEKSKKVDRKLGLRAYSEDVLVRTPWVNVTVLP